HRYGHPRDHGPRWRRELPRRPVVELARHNVAPDARVQLAGRGRPERGTVNYRRGMYTHGHHESVLRSHRWRTAENSAAYLLGHLAPGMSLLDVGSGPGTITLDLAERVFPGPVTALEATASALDLTRREAERRGGPPLTYVVGDVHALDFPDASFDVVHRSEEHTSELQSLTNIV